MLHVIVFCVVFVFANSDSCCIFNSEEIVRGNKNSVPVKRELVNPFFFLFEISYNFCQKFKGIQRKSIVCPATIIDVSLKNSLL